ncbi:MAG: aspartate aminotransferase family protein, partial [bacterium]|nr:aspartate aminotransferase family protein [bacterium]
GPQQGTTDLQPLVDFQDHGVDTRKLKQMIRKHLVPHLMKYDLPGFQSMFNGFPEKGAEIGAQIALTFNQGVTNWQVSPGGAMLEELCCKKMCKLFKLSPNADGTIMYSGTYANQEALYLALHRKAEQCGFDLAEKGLTGFKDPSRLTVLISEDAHFSLRHAVRMLGLGEKSLVPLAVGKNRRIDIEQLKKKINLLQDKDIFCIVATAGTTSTGSVDPIRPLAPICRRLGAWLHVDGAYGLVYSLVPGWEGLYAGLELADSVSWDPHKQMGVPIPNSLLFVADKNAFNRISLYSHYYNRREDEEPNPGLKSPPSTRPLAALPLVTSLRYQGIKKVIQRLRMPLIAVKKLARYLEKQTDIELFHSPDTGILCFRMTPEGVPADRLDDLQRHLFKTIMDEGKRSISITKLAGKNLLRLVAISPAVTFAALRETISVVRSLTSDYLKELP